MRLSHHEPSLEDKKSFFEDLAALDSYTSSEDESFTNTNMINESQNSITETHGTKLLHNGQHHTRASTPPNAQGSRHGFVHLRRTASSPIGPLAVESQDAIKTSRSYQSDKARPNKDTATAMASSPGSGDTPIPDSTRAMHMPAQLERSASTPNPLLRHLLPSDRQDVSPSFGADSRKRKRKSCVNEIPENRQVLRGLTFYYVPDNDIAAARRIRIQKAQQWGAIWTRSLENATHVVVDKNLAWKDVHAILTPINAKSNVFIVNEEYPLDCIQHHHVLNPNQNQYKLVGCPETQSKKDLAVIVESTPPESSLPLKQPRTNAKRRDYTPSTQPQTTLQSQDSSKELRGRVDAQVTAKSLPPLNSAGKEHIQQECLPNEAESRSVLLSHKDDLSECISQMMEFKDLHLGIDEENEPVDTAHDMKDTLKGGRDGMTHERNASRDHKDVTWQSKFSCATGGLLHSGQNNPNARTMEILQKMSDFYSRIDDHWRTTAYRRVLTILKRQTVKITTADQAIQLPGVGRRLAEKIEEIVTTDRLQRLEHAEKEPQDEILQTFLKIYGVGNAQANRWIAQGFRTLDDLQQNAKLTANQKLGIEHYDDLNTRIPRREIEALGDFVKSAAASLDDQVELVIGGSYRRGSESSGDIDFIVTKKGTTSSVVLMQFLLKLTHMLEAQGFLAARLSASRDDDGSKWHGCCVLPRIEGVNDDDEYRPIWRRIDFLAVPESEMGAALIYFTGNDIFNRSIRLLASKKGMRLNQRGLYKDVLRGPGRVEVTEGDLVEGRDERKIFEILGVQWRPPHERWC